MEKEDLTGQKKKEGTYSHRTEVGITSSKLSKIGILQVQRPKIDIGSRFRCHCDPTYASSWRKVVVSVLHQGSIKALGRVVQLHQKGDWDASWVTPVTPTVHSIVDFGTSRVLPMRLFFSGLSTRVTGYLGQGQGKTNARQRTWQLSMQLRTMQHRHADGKGRPASATTLQVEIKSRPKRRPSRLSPPSPCSVPICLAAIESRPCGRSSRGRSERPHWTARSASTCTLLVTCGPRRWSADVSSIREATISTRSRSNDFELDNDNALLIRPPDVCL